MQWKQKLLCGVVCLAQLACLSLPAWAEGRITTDMTMKEIRSDPAIVGCGISTYLKGDADDLTLRSLFEQQTLENYIGKPSAQDSADGLNLAIENYEAGRQVTWQVYSPDEIAADSSLGCVQLYWFPAERPGGKYALVLGGNVAMTSGELNEGIATAAQLHELGYTVFVLRHRIWWDLGDNGPLQDLGRAVQYITAHAEQFGVQPEQYALVGYSSGGHMEGLFSSEKTYGYRAYDVPKPGALLMAYPINDFAELKPVYHVLVDLASHDWKYYWSRITDGITAEFPPTYFWYGKNDDVLKMLCYPAQGSAIRKALEANDVPHQVTVYQNAPHAASTGNGTDAEGWLTDAVAFWEANTN